MDDSWALITRGKPDQVGFEFRAVRNAQDVVAEDWPRGLVSEELAVRMPKVISLLDVQEQDTSAVAGGGFRLPGAPEVFAELVGLGVLRPVTGQQMEVIREVVSVTGAPSGIDDQSVWFEVVPETLKVLYPRKL